MRVQSVVRATVFVAAFGFLALQTRADTFDFSYSGSVYNADSHGLTLYTYASGVLTTTDTEVNGALLITGITGSRTTNYYMGHILDTPESNTITGLFPPGAPNLNPGPPWDNLLYPNSSTLLDGQGFAYMLNCTQCGSNGYGFVQVAGFNGAYFELGSASLNSGDVFTITPAPEPKPFTTFTIVAFAAILYKVRLISGKRSFFAGIIA